MRYVLLLAGLLAIAASPDGWRAVGPGGGGAFFHPTVSPDDTRTVLVACDMTGAYVTHDAGRTWRMFNLRAPVRLFAFDPGNARVIYAATDSAMHRSTDGGETWRMVLPKTGAIRKITMSGDEAEETIEWDGEPRGAVTALAIDPKDSQSLYAGVGTALWHSADQGATWKREADFGERARGIWIGRDDAVYVAGQDRIRIGRKGKWQAGESPGRFVDVSGGAPVFYATSADRIFVSEDGGMTWRESPLPGFQGRASMIACSDGHPDVAYVSYSGLRMPLSATRGVAKTTDRGRHWELVWQNGRATAANVHDGWITERFTPGWPGNPAGIGVSASDPAVAYTTDAGRVVRTTNGGKTWDAVYSRRTADGGWTTTGLDATSCYGVHFDPFDARHVLLSCTDVGIVASKNGGASWRIDAAGVPERWANTAYWLDFDPKVHGRVWAAVSGTHDLPRSKMWRSRSPETYTGGVVVSDDGGSTWRASSEGMPESAVTHVLLDPASPENARVLYAAAFGRGVYKSADGGRHWMLKNSGIQGQQPFAWRLARDAAGMLYLVAAARAEDGALYRSSDGAEHWIRLRLPEGVMAPNGIAIDAVDSRRLYLAAWGANGGVYLSADSGSNWRRTLADDQHIYDVTADPSDPRVLYAAGFESSAWRSGDRGVTWRRIAGFNFKWGHRVIPDPIEAGMVYVTTFGGGVWHGRPAQ